jgi:hypothetical protein
MVSVWQRASDTDRVTQASNGGREFVPSAHGFAFANSWPEGPAVSVPLLIGSLGIGNAARGLCGGMVFAALDYWHAGLAPQADQPCAGTPLFRFVVRRLVNSWNLPAGVARYYRWMRRPDGDLARLTADRHWPAVRASIDAGVPAALGLVTMASANPLLLGANHQALAYGYSVAGTQVTLRVYDPNSGPDDAIWIRFDARGPAGQGGPGGTGGPAGTGAAGAFSHNLDLRLPVRGFFLTRYRPARPPMAGEQVTARSPRARRGAGTPSY